jgi:hypothetical protein
VLAFLGVGPLESDTVTTTVTTSSSTSTTETTTSTSATRSTLARGLGTKLVVHKDRALGTVAYLNPG